MKGKEKCWSKQASLQILYPNVQFLSAIIAEAGIARVQSILRPTV
jgi:hypothetical protein